MPLQTKYFPQSKQIDKATYDTEKQSLDVVFSSGRGTYRYNKVPETVWKQFKDALSPGSFLNKEIKNIFEYSKIS